MSGLNDEFLLADTSAEPDAPTVVVNAFKDTEVGEVPELRDDVDLIAVATEELFVTLRDLDLLKQNINEQGGMSQAIALEAQAIMPQFLRDDRPVAFFTKHPSRTMLTTALEEIEEEKKSALSKVWDFIIGLLRRLLAAVVKFFSDLDLEKEYEREKKAQLILKNKRGTDFVDAVVKRVPAEQLAIICAIEEDKDFVPTYFANIKIDRDFVVPVSVPGRRDIEGISGYVQQMAEGIEKCNSSIAVANAKDEEDRDRELRRMLASGLSINGSEHNAYFKSFERTSNEEQRYDKLIKLCEKYKRDYVADEVVDGLKKLAAVMAQQFTLEAKVVKAYSKLIRAVIDVNDKIYAGA